MRVFWSRISRKTRFFGANGDGRGSWARPKWAPKTHQISRYHHLPREIVFSLHKVHCVQISTRSEQIKSVLAHTNEKPRIWFTYTVSRSVSRVFSENSFLDRVKKLLVCSTSDLAWMDFKGSFPNSHMGIGKFSIILDFLEMNIWKSGMSSVENYRFFETFLTTRGSI